MKKEKQRLKRLAKYGKLESLGEQNEDAKNKRQKTEENDQDLNEEVLEPKSNPITKLKDRSHLYG